MIATFATYAPRLAGRLMPNVVTRVPTSERRLYLTFDDGPTSDFTQKILDQLDAHDAKATFFLVGENTNRHPDIAAEIVRRGHPVAGHTYRHLDPWQHSAGTILDDFVEGCDAIEAATGEPVTMVRPPYGRLRPCITRWARATGRRVVMWDVMPADYRPGAEPDEMARFIMKTRRRGSVVVLHDNPRSAPATPQMLDILLPRLRDSGWACSALH